jgi:hypothetical protein
MTNQKLITLLVVSLAIGVAQCWALYHFLGLELAESRSIIVPVSFLAIILGWSMIAVYAVIPFSKTNRWRGMIRALIPIFGGTSGLSAEAHSEAWTDISIVAVLGAALLAFLPFIRDRLDRSTSGFDV